MREIASIAALAALAGSKPVYGAELLIRLYR